MLFRSGFMRGGTASVELGRSCGIWEGILGTLGIPYSKVMPNVWKPAMLAGLPSGKQTSVEQAIRLFPDASVRSRLYGPRGGIIDGRAEALLLAEYSRRHWRLSGKRAA